MKLRFALILSLVFATVSFAREVWTSQQAKEWASKLPYLSGVNYVPSTAINSIEIWRAETFDEKTIRHEMGLLKSLGMNTVRVFLNDLVYEKDSKGMFERIDKFLEICEEYDVYVMFTFFTNGGLPEPVWGEQPKPRPGIHNSGWMKTPRLSVLQDETKWGYLKDYVHNTVKRYANHPRVVVWDIFNEPGNVGSAHIAQKELSQKIIEHNTIQSKKLMLAAFKWARDANPSQPCTASIWESSKKINNMFHKEQLENCDIITYHCYGTLHKHVIMLQELLKHNRPIMCTEWMARHTGSGFNPILEFLKANDIDSYAFGLKAGKIQTELVWPSLQRLNFPGVNQIWFHDIFDKNDKPYCKEEVDYIRRILGAKKWYEFWK